MSELGDIHEKINRISNDMAHMSGLLEGKLDSLTTLPDVIDKIAEHKAHCNPSINPSPKLNGKFTAAIISVIVALTATIVALVQLLP